MAYCKICGNEVEEDDEFCIECGSNLEGNVTLKPPHNINTNSNPFTLYNIDMISGEMVIADSEVHKGCFVAPGTLVAIGFTISFVVLLKSSVFYYGIPLLLFFNPILIIGVIWFFIRLLAYIRNDLILTNKRVFGRCGLIFSTQMQSPLNKIDSVSFTNGIIGKLLGYGTVRITTASSKFKFRFIKDGHTLYSDIFNQLEINEKEVMEKQARAIANAISKQ